MVAALAGVVHDRQRAAGPEQDHCENNQQRSFHCDLATAPDATQFPGYLGLNEAGTPLTDRRMHATQSATGSLPLGLGSTERPIRGNRWLSWSWECGARLSRVPHIPLRGDGDIPDIAGHVRAPTLSLEHKRLARCRSLAEDRCHL
jgi:hypothetical protein